MLILRNIKGSPLTWTEMDDNLIYLEGLTADVPGTNYILVKGTGTPTENGTELETAYTTAKTMSPTVDNRITIVVFPGEYGLSGKLILDTPYINLVSLTGNRDVILDRADVVGDPFEFTPPSTIVTSDVLLIDADYVYVKGMVGKLRNSPNFVSIGGTSDYILPIQVGDNLPNIVVENCVGGLASFGGDITQSNPIEVSGTFTNCVGGLASFGAGGTTSGTFSDCEGSVGSFGGSTGTASGTFTNCTGGDSSFGGGPSGTASGDFKDCTGGDSSFGGVGTSGTASGTFTNCTGGVNSFGGNGGDASGIFTNCTGSVNSFGGDGGTASGTFKDCIGGNYSFGGNGGDASGAFTNCIGDVFSFGGIGTASGTFENCTSVGHTSFGRTASGTFTNCVGGNNSFGGETGGVLDGTLINCRLTTGTFKTVTGTGRTYFCIDGNGVVNNQ